MKNISAAQHRPNTNLADTSLTSDQPLVSVAITAFNSADWLGRALDSVLQQKTNFSLEIVIGDDCSQDATVSVANSYRERYPNTIRLLQRTKNLGIQRNYYETFEHCRGEFIAWLDADDYWTDPDKIALQVETMKSDDSISACAHFVRWVTNTGEINRDRYPTIDAGRYGLDEIIHHNFLPSPSVMFRNGIHRSLPEWYFELAPTTDWPIWVLAALSGSIVLIDRVMADYVLTPNSSLMGKGDLYWFKTDARFYEHIESVVPAKWSRLVRAEKGRRYESIAYWAGIQGDFSTSRTAALKAFCGPFPLDRIGTKTKALLVSLVREARCRVTNKIARRASNLKID